MHHFNLKFKLKKIFNLNFKLKKTQLSILAIMLNGNHACGFGSQNPISTISKADLEIPRQKLPLPQNRVPVVGANGYAQAGLFVKPDGSIYADLKDKKMDESTPDHENVDEITIYDEPWDLKDPIPNKSGEKPAYHDNEALRQFPYIDQKEPIYDELDPAVEMEYQFNNQPNTTFMQGIYNRFTQRLTHSMQDTKNLLEQLEKELNDKLSEDTLATYNFYYKPSQAALDKYNIYYNPSQAALLRHKYNLWQLSWPYNHSKKTYDEKKAYYEKRLKIAEDDINICIDTAPLINNRNITDARKSKELRKISKAHYLAIYNLLFFTKRIADLERKKAKEDKKGCIIGTPSIATGAS